MSNLKILYAVSNNLNSKIILQRFLEAVDGKPYTIKIAAYKKSSPSVNIDWTLDSLLNIYKPDHISLENNDNLLTYFKQIKYYFPDLIISDAEYFTSYIANILNIPLWQCSSSLLNYAIINREKYNVGIFKKYSYLTRKNSIATQRIINIIDNSDKNFVYSHFGDSNKSPTIKNNFEWVRPYHKVGKISVPCNHNIVAGVLTNNKKIFAVLQKYHDSIVFSEFIHEHYKNINLKYYGDQSEYFCNLRNSNLFVCEGHMSFLADAFYNDKYSIIIPNFDDPECVINSIFSEKIGIGSCVYDQDQNLEQYTDFSINNLHNKKIKFLHEKLEEI